MDRLIEKITKRVMASLINEGVWNKTATPHLSKDDTHRMLGNNPLTVDNGGHAARDKVLQASTIDVNGANYVGETITLSKPEYFQYKKRTFGFGDKKLTKDQLDMLKQKTTKTIFGGDSKAWRNAIDTACGGAKRGGKGIQWRFITDGESGRIAEFTLNGNEWFVLCPQPLQKMLPSGLDTKTLEESLDRIILTNINNIKNFI